MSLLLPQRYYIPSARELQRIESVTRSPIYSKFSEALAGVATIRAYRKETYFTDMSDNLMQVCVGCCPSLAVLYVRSPAECAHIHCKWWTFATVTSYTRLWSCLYAA